MANLMNNGKSKCHNSIVIIEVMHENKLIDLFIHEFKFKKGIPKYIQIVQEIQNRIKLGKIIDYSMEEIYLAKWLIQQNWKSSLSDYLKELYPKLISFLGNWYKTQQSTEWQREIENLCWEVEALCELGQYEQAATLLKTEEHKINNKYGNNITSYANLGGIYLEKFVLLKLYLNALVPSVAMNQEKEEKIIFDFFRHFATRWNDWKNKTNEDFITSKININSPAHKHFFYHLLELYSKQISKAKGLDLKLKAIEEKLPNPYIPTLTTKKDSEDISIIQANLFRKYILLLQKLYIAYDIDDVTRQHEAIKAINETISKKELTSFTLKFILGIHQFERGFSISENKEDFLEKLYEKVEVDKGSLFSHFDIENVLCRFEVNNIILLFRANEFEYIWTQYFHKDNNIAKKNPFISLRLELNILRILTFFELTQKYRGNNNAKLVGLLKSPKKRRKNNSEETSPHEAFDASLKTVQRYLRSASKNNIAFELAKEIICKIKPHRNYLSRNNILIELNLNELESINKNSPNPINRLLMEWLQADIKYS